MAMNPRKKKSVSLKSIKKKLSDTFKGKNTPLNAKKMRKKAFDKAFASAKKAGKKTFTFQGDKFNTMTKEDVAKKKKTTLARNKSMGKMKVGLRAASGGMLKKMRGGGMMKKMRGGGMMKKKMI
jgi:hypothetical protein